MGAKSHVRSVMYLCFNFASAILIILMNKALFSKLHFPAPSLLTAIQYVVIWALSRTQRYANSALLSSSRSNDTSPLKSKSPPEIRNFWPMALIMGIPVLVSNYSLEFNNVGFYQLAKTLQTPTIVLMDWLIAGKQPPSPRCLCALAAVLAGVIFSSVSDISVSLLGLCIALANLPLQCMSKVLTSKYVREGHEPLQLLERLMPASAMILAIVSLPLEGRLIWNSGADGIVHALPMICMSSVSAFLVQWSGVLVLGHTSALTYQLSGQLKSCVLMLGGALLFAEETNWRTIGGASLAIIAASVYTIWNLADQKAMKAEDKKRKLRRDPGMAV
eukprot:gnl/TRDRNA2_/TRDRNA2_67120_c0_seq1.p1 gnl/TRDRNA2_/TRDRNA2_67120_c0~~gnl/TRDRNA2_/TRDRNA2_67120_c0_seq1.p1  ORF type:complete len:332 (+),score=40.94 gnl/TRDRNA2_/TRDRNA2_67120_c0_seq1:89-1084(+)